MGFLGWWHVSCNTSGVDLLHVFDRISHKIFWATAMKEVVREVVVAWRKTREKVQLLKVILMPGSSTTPLLFQMRMRRYHEKKEKKKKGPHSLWYLTIFWSRVFPPARHCKSACVKRNAVSLHITRYTGRSLPQLTCRYNLVVAVCSRKTFKARYLARTTNGTASFFITTWAMAKGGFQSSTASNPMTSCFYVCNEPLLELGKRIRGMVCPADSPQARHTPNAMCNFALWKWPKSLI